MAEPSRTTVEADDALLAEAAAALGTTGPEETVRAALELAARRRPGSPPWPGRPRPSDARPWR
ncbi:MAG: type II toxin-antitoxin system VapB family antitoxin, partial [Pseudonocardiales bacterium]|nr:type II toxin-antitoxin system VapB family antitoxin [Pseudonocardiales bacterium]